MNDDRAQQLIEQLHERVKQMVTGADWLDWLRLSSRFHNYSPNNVLLIVMQRPDATRVAGFKTWQSMGRNVRKGEKGIAILRPNKRWITKEDDDGHAQRVQIVTGFGVVHVFDIAQTDGEPIVEPPRPVLLEGEAPEELRVGLIQAIQAQGFVLRFPGPANWHTRANGYTDFHEKVVAIRPELSHAQQAKTLAHELGHVLLHADFDYFRCRGIAEVEAESVAAVVMMAHGIDSADYSLPYVVGWSDGDLKLVLATAERVNKAASQVLASLEPASDAA